MEDHPYPPPPPQVCSSAKGKRTKRQKPHSPTPFEVVPDHSNDIMSSTEEEEDMANCLILLAQGQSKPSPDSPHHHHHLNNNKEQEDEQHYYYYPPPPPPPSNHHQQPPIIKYNSKRYLETGNKTAGYYVYECKTCNRTFPSFQALGGHRASHKKPKLGPGTGDHHSQFFPTTPLQDKKQLFTLLPSDHTDHDQPGAGHFRKTSSLSLHLSTNNNNNGNNTSKVHECSICGAEFMSGQALGGHMRRHRSAPHNIHTNGYNNKTPIIVANPNITTLSLTPLIDKLELDQTEEHHPSAEAKEVLSLDLDLNLPASGQDHQETTAMAATVENNNKLQQQIDKKTSQPSSSSSAKVFSASPTLVDCHY